MNSMSITQPISSSKVDSLEEAWIKEAQKNIKAFEKLYDKHYEAIFRYVYQRMDSREDATDVTSQVFIKAMTNIKKYKFMGFKFSSWLYRIAKSETYQFLKDQSKSPTLNINTTYLTQIGEELESTSPLDNEALIDILNGLEASELELIEMRFFEQRSFKEIGEILNLTENNAKVKTHRVIKKIRKNNLPL